MNNDTHGSNKEEWIGFDLDGTLAKYDGWKGVEHIGEPVTTMVVVAKLLHWLGKKIKILTARVAPREDGDGGDKARKYIEKWCEKNLGFVPDITHLKDASMAALFDDRAVAVEQNTGKVLGGWPDFLPKATEKAKKAILSKSASDGASQSILDKITGEDRRYRISGAILGCLGDNAKRLKYKVDEDLGDDPWRAIISSDGDLTLDDVNDWHKSHVTDVDGKGVPYYFMVSNVGTGKKYVLFGGDRKWYPIDTEKGRKAAVSKGIEKGIDKEQLDFAEKQAGSNDWKSKTLSVIKRRDPDGIESMARLHYPDEGSHGWNHIRDVIESARRMKRRELLKKELAAIMYHDSSLMTGPRETHAEDSAEIARKELGGVFSASQLKDIVNAIAHHRASYKGSRASKLEDLVASADRPVPDLAKQVIRSWKYHEELGEPENERAKNVADHLREKYGLSGYAYANAPKLYLKTYGDELNKSKELFEGLTPDKVRTVVAGMAHLLTKVDPHGAEKRADIKLKDGKYVDVKKIYDSLTDEEKNFVTPGRRVYKDVPALSSTVAYRGRKPVGFANIYPYPTKSKRDATFSIAVSSSERGHGLAGKMSHESIRKLIRQIRKNREAAEQGGDESLREFERLPRLERFFWDVLSGNDASARAAVKSGFKERFVPSRKWRRFVMKRDDAERIADTD